MAYAEMWILTTEGPEVVEVADPFEASRVGSYWNAVKGVTEGTDHWGVQVFDGERIAGRALETNPEEILFWARAGELRFQDIYQG